MRRRFNTRSTILPAITTLVAACIFIADTVTDLEIAVSVLYVAVVLLSLGFCQRRGVILVSLGCMTLSIASHILTRSGIEETGLINCGLGLLAIGATALLSLKIDSAEVAAHEARAQLAHVARVTALGELTASIAHEVNQPIAATVINGNASLHWLSAEPPNLDETREALRRIISDANRAADVITRVRAMAKPAPPQKALLNLSEVVREVLSLTSKEIENGQVTLTVELTEDLPPVLADRVQLQQVILNLVINAVEAIHSVGGAIRALSIATTHEGSSVRVAVRDTGGGLNSEKTDRLFDAFFTTKREGMGMGLAISRSIIEAHGGRIWGEPNTPAGAIFCFQLPVAGKS